MYSVYYITFFRCSHRIIKNISEDPKGITKIYLYNFDPLKPHFYIVKLGFTVVYIIFLISAQNKYVDCGLITVYVLSRNIKKKLSVLVGEIFKIFEYACFRNECHNDKAHYKKKETDRTIRTAQTPHKKPKTHKQRTT